MKNRGFSFFSYCLIVIAISAGILSGVFLAFAASDMSLPTYGPNDAVVEDLNKKLDEQRNKIDTLTAKIGEYNANISANRQQASTLSSEIMLLNNQIGKTQMEAQLKEEQSKEVQLQIDQTNIQISQTEKQIASEKDQLADILRLIARYEDQDYLSIMLSHDTFSDFFDQMKYSTDLQQEAQRSLNRIQEIDAKLNDQEQKLTDQRKELSDILNKLDDTKAVLSDKKQDKNQLMVATKNSEKKYQAMVQDLKKAQLAANAQINNIESQLRAELAKKGTKEKFNTLSNAALIWPTASHRITCVFHDPDYPYRNLFEHSGLDIGVGQGTTVSAADAGYVAKVAYGTKWYGNYILIIHGGNISTLYGHLSAINVAQDQYVTRGQNIGLSGNTGFSSGPHLHFEVRSNGIPVNPLSYLP